MNTSAARDPRLGEHLSLPLTAVFTWLAVGALTAIWFALACGRALTQPDEGRYAEIPLEMLVSGDWITPHLNGVAYLEKPPLQYWATAVTYALLGPSEWTARFWTMLSAWLDVVLVFLLGRRLWDRRTGAIAAGLLATSLLHFATGQLITLDMAFTCWMTGTLCAFCMAQVDRDSAPRAAGYWMLAAWALLALATLTKGVAAPLIAAAVLLIYALWQRDWMVLRRLRIGVGLPIFAAITLPWFVLVARANPDFLQFFFIHEHLQRYLTHEAQRVEAWWYFIAILAAGVLPWLPQTASAMFNGWRTTVAPGKFDVCRLLWLWCVFVLVFFSLSGSKLAPYVLPALPPLALLTAARESPESVRWTGVSLCIVMAFAIAGLAFVLMAPDDPVVQRALLFAAPAAVSFGVIATLAAVVWWIARRRGRPLLAAGSIGVAWFLGLALLFAALGQNGSLRSGRDLASQIPAELVQRAPFFSVQTYDQTLPFYLRRTMTLVDTRDEFDYGLRHAPEKTMTMAEFERHWVELPEAVAIMPHDTYSRFKARGLPMKVLGEDERHLAVGRR